MNSNSLPFIGNNSSISTYAEDLFKNNIGKLISLYMSFPNKDESTKFKGILESVGKDFVLISDPSNGKWYMLIIPYLNYVEFEEEVNK